MPVAAELHDRGRIDVPGIASVIEDALSDRIHGRSAGGALSPCSSNGPAPTLTIIEVKRKSFRPPHAFSISKPLGCNIPESGRRPPYAPTDEKELLDQSDRR